MLYLGFFLCCLTVIALPTLSSKILAIVPTPSYSHQIVFNPVWRELSLRGHHVTLLTTDPIKDPSLTNLTEIDLHFTYKEYSKNVAKFIEHQRKGIKSAGAIGIAMLTATTRSILQHREVKNLIEDPQQRFDLVLTETLHPIMLAFAKRFNCPSVGLATRDVFHHNYHCMGNPSHPIVNPEIFLGFGEKLSFWERVRSVYNIFYGWFLFKNDYDKINKEIIDEFFGAEYPSTEEMERDVDMLFLYANSIFHRIRPLVPTIIHIGGNMHIKSPKALPKDLQKILDNSPNGVIYFSLGTNAKSKNLPIERRNMLLEAFSELPYTVLWKFETEMKDIPLGNFENVRIAKWYPQQDIFNHSNIKLFITQGGLQSLEEAVHYKIPVLGLPVVGDQFSNTKRAASKGIGIQLHLDTLDKTSFQAAITEIINNPKYKENINKVSQLIKDQPMTGLEKTVWWTEYLLRHKGAGHLRSPMLDIPAYQYYLLDVIGFAGVIVLTATYIIIKIVGLFIKSVKRILGNSDTKVKIN